MKDKIGDFLFTVLAIVVAIGFWVGIFYFGLMGVASH